VVVQSMRQTTPSTYEELRSIKRYDEQNFL